MNRSAYLLLFLSAAVLCPSVFIYEADGDTTYIEDVEFIDNPDTGDQYMRVTFSAPVSGNITYTITGDSERIGALAGSGDLVKNTVFRPNTVNSPLGGGSYLLTVNASSGSMTYSFEIEGPALYQVTVRSGDSDYGTVSDTGTVSGILEGTVISIMGDTLTVGEHVFVAVPNEGDGSYRYSFAGWSVSDGTVVTADMSIVASFTRVPISVDPSVPDEPGDDPTEPGDGDDPKDDDDPDPVNPDDGQDDPKDDDPAGDDDADVEPSEGEDGGFPILIIVVVIILVVILIVVMLWIRGRHSI